MPRLPFLLVLTMLVAVTESHANTDIEVSAIAGFGVGIADTQYSPSKTDDPLTSKPEAVDRHYASVPKGAISVALTTSISRSIAIGGVLRVGTTRSPNAYSGKKERGQFITLGPQITASAPSRVGAYASFAIGPARFHGLGASTTIAGGYRQPLSKGWLLGLGMEATGLWTKDSEDGDFGTYKANERFATLGLVVSLLRR